MKKLISVMLILLVCVSLTACGSDASSKTVDFVTVKDTQTGEVYKLGDPQTKFDEAYGAADISQYELHRYLDVTLLVSYDSENSADSIGIRDFAHFDMTGVNLSLSESEILAEGFIETYGSESRNSYGKHFDASGKTVEEDSAAYTVYLAYEGGVLVSAEFSKSS